MDNIPTKDATNSISHDKQTTTKRKTTNIEMSPLATLTWKSPEETQASILTAYRYAEEKAEKTISWYLKNKSPKAIWSRCLRFAAIALTAFGGLAPIVGSIGWLSPQRSSLAQQLGYLLLGSAAACVGVDKFFGFSSGWMRYIKTTQTLERARSEFRMDWAMMIAKLAGKVPTVDQIQSMLQRLKEFMLFIDSQVEQETQAWIAEFRSNLTDLERTTKEQGEAARPGAIDVTVTNGMETEDGFTLSLDGMVVQKVHGTKYQIGYVPPGPHKIGVTGIIGGKALDASELVTVAAGEVFKATLALPVEEAQP